MSHNYNETKQKFIEAIPTILKADFSKSRAVNEFPDLLPSFLQYVKQSPNKTIWADLRDFQQSLTDKNKRVLIWWVTNYLVSHYCGVNPFDIVLSDYDFLQRFKRQKLQTKPNKVIRRQYQPSNQSSFVNKTYKSY